MSRVKELERSKVLRRAKKSISVQGTQVGSARNDSSILSGKINTLGNQSVVMGAMKIIQLFLLIPSAILLRPNFLFGKECTVDTTI